MTPADGVSSAKASLGRGGAPQRPAINVNRVIAGGQMVGLLAIGVPGLLAELWLSQRRPA